MRTVSGEHGVDDPTGQPRSGPTRRRGADLEQAILRAALDELAETGYAGLTMDRVARRAGTNKNAIYRRWPNRAALGLAAYQELVVTDQELPDTGELRGDVLELLRRANRHLSSPAGDILRSLLGSSRRPGSWSSSREQTADAAPAPG